MAAPWQLPRGAGREKWAESRRLSAERFAEGYSPPVPTLIGHEASLPLSLESQKNNSETGDALGEQSLQRESPYYHPRGNVASLVGGPAQTLTKIQMACIANFFA